MTAAPNPVDQAVLDDLRERLRRIRWVPPADPGTTRGVDREVLNTLVEAWVDFDWRPVERRLLGLPWETAAGIRLLHQRAEGDAPTVVLLHGWPDSFLRYERVLPLLDDVNVVVPCLPGFPYATGPWEGTHADVAERLHAALTELGYDRFVVSGGDVGSSVAEHWASRHPESVAALHLTDIPYTHIFAVDAGDLSPEEQAFLGEGQTWQFAEGAYALEQGTKPDTLAVGLGDSPAGLAAWIVEKLTSWSASDGDVESVFPRADILTWLTLYWTTGCIGTSFGPYATGGEPPEGRIEVPTVATIFPGDLVPAPRAFGERFFDIVSWTELSSGGHFGAWEHPDAFVAGVREAVRTLPA